MTGRILLLLASTTLLASCFQGDANGVVDEDEDGGGTVDTEVVLKLHPQKEFCVEYKHEGQLSGTSKHCMRNWGAEAFTIENFKIGFGGFSQDQNAHKIIIGDTIYNIDPAKKTGKRTKNPFFDTISKSDPEQLGKIIMDGMGMTDTGEDKEIDGVSCNILRSEQLGSACLTDNMVMLEQEVMGVKQIATKVDLNSGGDDADYRLYENVTITEGPDVGAILEGL